MTFEKLISDTDFLLNISDGSYAIADKTRNINNRLDDVVSIILGSDGRWQFDDSNYTDLPIGTTILVDGQQDYNVQGATFLDITRVDVMDINGNYMTLTPFDQRDLTQQSLSEFQKTPGMPRFYDKLGDSIFLYPKPSSSMVTLTAGLKVYFQRVGSYFVVTDTTKVPGFSPLYHRLLSIGSALDYAVSRGLDKKIKILEPRFQKMEQDLISFYASRSKDEQVRMRPRRESYGAEGTMGYGSNNNGYRDNVAF